MPAACSLSGRLSTRNASMTMSCVADAVATSQRADARRLRRGNRIAQAEQRDRRDQHELRQDEPAAPPAEQARQHRHVERVDQRRPEKLDRVGRADHARTGRCVFRLTPLPRAHTCRVEPDSASGSPAEKPRNITTRTRGLQVDRERFGKRRPAGAGDVHFADSGGPHVTRSRLQSRLARRHPLLLRRPELAREQRRRTGIDAGLSLVSKSRFSMCMRRGVRPFPTKSRICRTSSFA